MEKSSLDASFSTGGEECLSAAIALYGQPLLHYCHHILCDYHEAQDAVQTTFLKAWQRRERFQGGSLSAWLYRLAYTTSIDLMRRKKRQLFAPPPAAVPAAPDYIGEELRAALLTLTAQERALVFGRVMEALSFEDLAARHDVSAAALRKRYERARKKLARALTASEPTAKEDLL